ncbi:hypothetical protein BDQ17DRAFT_1337908, partial [Cyathus striatus]
YTVEILPYALRAKGFVVFNFAVSLSLIFNQYVNPIALKLLDGNTTSYQLVYVFWLTFETAFCYFFIIETKNLTLEETAAIAEKAAEQAGISHHENAEKRSDTDSVEKATEEIIN